MDREKFLEKFPEFREPPPFEKLLAFVASMPEPWRSWAAHESLEHIRYRLRMTQNELAQKSGLTQSQVSRLEGGEDALVSSWRRLYAAMGFELVLLPVSALDAKGLEEQASIGMPRGWWYKSRVRPRHRWLKERIEAARRRREATDPR